MPTSYNVRLWKLERYVGKTATTYAVRWTVQGRPFKSRFATKALADSFRSHVPHFSKAIWPPTCYGFGWAGV